MVDIFAGGTQRDPRHTQNIPNTPDNQQDDLFSVLRDAASITHESDDNDQALTTAEEFERYHEQNPAIYKAMVILCRQWISRTGRRKLGINAVVERTRWEIAVQTNTDPKIDNNFAPYFARLIMAQERDLAGLFDLRRSGADEWIARRLDQDRRAA